MERLGHHKTYPTTCRDCQASIFFHTNGFGDVVLFDVLGPPWSIHPCYQSKVGGQIIQDSSKYRAYMVDLYGSPSRFAQPNLSFPSQRDRVRHRRSALDHTERLVDIARCEPGNFLGKRLQITGFVQDLHEGWSIARLASVGSIGFAQYQRVIGTDVYSQLTVIDGDFMSYTMIVPAAELLIRRGAIVALLVEGVETLKDPVFICRSLSLVRLGRSGPADSGEGGI